jgi:hypothetical protein
VQLEPVRGINKRALGVWVRAGGGRLWVNRRWVLMSYCMSISGVLVRFLGAYLELFIIFTLVVAVLMLLGMHRTGVLDAFIVIGAVLWACAAFGKKNQRYFTAQEKRKVIGGMISIDLLLMLPVVAWLLHMETVMKPDISTSALMLLGIIGIIIEEILHAIIIMYFVNVVGKRMVNKRLQKMAGTSI